MASQIVPYVNHQLNAAPYEEERSSRPGFDKYVVKAIVTRNRSARPGALEVTVGEGTWGADNPTTTTFLSRCPPWPVTTYAQLKHALGFGPERGWEPSCHMLMLWIGGNDKGLPAVLHRKEGDYFESFVYNSLPGVSFFRFFEEVSPYKDYVARLVWEMVGEALVPATTTSGGT